MSRESAVPSPRHPHGKTSGKQVLVHLWGRNPSSPQTAAHSGLDTTAIDARGRFQSSELVRAVRFGVRARSGSATRRSARPRSFSDHLGERHRRGRGARPLRALDERGERQPRLSSSRVPPPSVLRGRRERAERQSLEGGVLELRDHPLRQPVEADGHCTTRRGATRLLARGHRPLRCSSALVSEERSAHPVALEPLQACQPQQHARSQEHRSANRDPHRHRCLEVELLERAHVVHRGQRVGWAFESGAF